MDKWINFMIQDLDRRSRSVKIENIGTKYDGWSYYKYLNIEYSIESK